MHADVESVLIEEEESEIRQRETGMWVSGGLTLSEARGGLVE